MSRCTGERMCYGAPAPPSVLPMTPEIAISSAEAEQIIEELTRAEVLKGHVLKVDPPPPYAPDVEITALGACVAALEKLDTEARYRVLRYLVSRWETEAAR